jgi:hypothetical protein
MKKRAFLRYRKDGDLIAGSLVITTNGSFPSGQGIWKEVSINICCPPIDQPSIIMTFDDINNIINFNIINLDAWNGLFDLPNNGIPFTDVKIEGNSVKLYGGGNIDLADSIFQLAPDLQTYMTKFDDVNGVIVTGGVGCFFGMLILTEVSLPALTTTNQSFFRSCPLLTTLNLPALTSPGGNTFRDCVSLTDISLPSVTNISSGEFRDCSILASVDIPNLVTIFCDVNFRNCTALSVFDFPLVTTIQSGLNFENCTGMTTLNLPSCIQLGQTTANNLNFAGIINKTITATFNQVLQTADGGTNPDGDIVSFQTNNPLSTVVYVL